MVVGLSIGVGLLLLVVWSLVPRGIPWTHALVRINPGAGKRAEWMAAPAVVGAVKRDFTATLAWLAECSSNWGRLAGELDQYALGDYRRRQLAALRLLVQSRGPRLAEALEADHDLAVQCFSADGLRCLVVDRQTARTVVTRAYWTGLAMHQQRLPDAVLVWQMVYDAKDRRWKIERLIQSLPAHSETHVRVSLAAELPVAAGRDN